MVHLSRLLIVVLVATGCAAAKARATYERQAWSSTERLIVKKGFSRALEIQGTYLSATFRKALAGERERLLGATATDAEAFLQRMADEGSAYHEVIFSAGSTLLDDTIRFGQDDEGWRIKLFADGHEETLVTVFKVRKPNALQYALYPHFDEWSSLWVARFERTVQSPAQVRLVVGSGWGNGSVAWEGPQLR